MYPYVTRIILVCLRMLLVCMCVTRVLLVCIRRRSSDVLSVWSRQIERVGRSKLIQTNLIQLDVERFMDRLNSLSFVRLIKSSTFGLGLCHLAMFNQKSWWEDSLILQWPYTHVYDECVQRTQSWKGREHLPDVSYGTEMQDRAVLFIRRLQNYEELRVLQRTICLRNRRKLSELALVDNARGVWSIACNGGAFAKVFNLFLDPKIMSTALNSQNSSLAKLHCAVW